MKYVCLFLCLSFSLTAKCESDLLAQGNELLVSKKYDEALFIYKQIEQNHLGGPGLYKNMSLAASSLGKNAEAILYLEKALKYEPNNKMFKSDLQVLRKTNPKLIDPIEPFFISEWWSGFCGVGSVGAWSAISLIVLCSLSVFIGMRFQSLTNNAGNQVILSTLLFCFVVSVAAAYQRQKTIMNNPGIIITASDSFLKMGPDQDSPSIEELPPGAKVFYIEHLGDWWQVTTEHGDEGWIKATAGHRI